MLIFIRSPKFGTQKKLLLYNNIILPNLNYQTVPLCFYVVDDVIALLHVIAFKLQLMFHQTFYVESCW